MTSSTLSLVLRLLFALFVGCTCITRAISSEEDTEASWAHVERKAFEEGKWQTNALLIIQDGMVKLEKYANGFTPTKPHRLWSITKSLSSLLVGIRLEEIKSDLNSPVAKLLPELNAQYPLKVRDLLQMSSGLKWNEFYEKNPFQSDVVKMLYLKEDMGGFVAGKPSHSRPGARFHYSSGETNLLMKWFQKSFDKDLASHEAYPWTKLFEPLGIESATWEQDSEGVFIGSSYAYMTAADLAKVGTLILNEGVHEENTIVPREYLRQSFLMAPAVCRSPHPYERTLGYGFHWWLNLGCPHKPRSMPNVPSDVFMALGHHGQIMAVFPSLKTVVVRLGADKKGKFPRREWLSLITKVVSR